MVKPAESKVYVPKLHPEQSYVMKHAAQLGIEARLVSHEVATNTCYEKAEILGWHPSRVVKALYFESESGQFVGIIVPELGKRIDQVGGIVDALKVSKRQARKYALRGTTPQGMEPGTCSPFPLRSSVNSEISNLIIYDSQMKGEVDISIGGTGEAAHKTSMHIPYRSIAHILALEFGTDFVKKTRAL